MSTSVRTPPDAGRPEFCERYARQTESNVYGTNSSNDENPELQARISGQDAYKRCLAGAHRLTASRRDVA